MFFRKIALLFYEKYNRAMFLGNPSNRLIVSKNMRASSFQTIFRVIFCFFRLIGNIKNL